MRRPLDTDLELIVAAQRGEQLAADQFVRRFLPVVYAVSRQFFMTGGSMDDIVSEGLHGLWKGVRSFDSDKLGKATVGTYVALCVRRQIVTAVVGALRFKHDPLNRARTWDVPTDDGDPLPILESFPDTGLPVVEQLEQSATLRALVAGIGALTELERRALVGVVFEGRSYAEIEGIARSRDSKQIDNAYQRAVKKLRARVLLPPTRLQLA